MILGRRVFRGLAAGLVVAVAGALVADIAFPIPYGRLQTPSTAFVDRHGALLAVQPAPGGMWRLATRVEDVDPGFVDRLIATEDRRFWWHPGVDPVSLARALAQDVRAGRIVSGGSTLTMQVARLLEPKRRTLLAKLGEMLRAFQLEAHHSKREILAMWLTLAPYGGNVEGVRAASLVWFGKLPTRLEPAEAAFLVALPRRPEALRADRHPAAAQTLRDRLLGEPGGAVPLVRHAMPRHAAAALPRPGAAGADIATTLDLPIQTAFEGIAQDAARTLPQRSALLLLAADLQTRQITAIASASPDGAGMALDLSAAVRSPGSALKPFVYAMAFEAGLAGPQSLINDAPRRFGAYAPEDFDRSFAGQVTMAEALRRSLNVPAVTLLEGVGPESFLQRLRAAGIVLHLPQMAASSPAASLPLALGGAGITPRDLAALYAALATDGHVRGWDLQGGAMTARPLLGRDAAASVADILNQPFPEGGPDGIAWKTGTSWGGRDAWAVGFDRAHLVLAWVGRPDSAPIAGATGRGLAVPLLARAFAVLPAAPRAAAAPVAALPLPSARTAPRSGALQLLFPPAQAVVSADGPLTLRAMGGQRPLSFLVDGVVLPHDPARREIGWLPPGPGWYLVTVLDALGQAVHATVRVR